jgi:hypothetical protein
MKEVEMVVAVGTTMAQTEVLDALCGQVLRYRCIHETVDGIREHCLGSATNQPKHPQRSDA